MRMVLLQLHIFAILSVLHLNTTVTTTACSIVRIDARSPPSHFAIPYYTTQVKEGRIFITRHQQQPNEQSINNVNNPRFSENLAAKETKSRTENQRQRYRLFRKGLTDGALTEYRRKGTELRRQSRHRQQNRNLDAYRKRLMSYQQSLRHREKVEHPERYGYGKFATNEKRRETARRRYWEKKAEKQGQAAGHYAAAKESQKSEEQRAVAPPSQAQQSQVILTQPSRQPKRQKYRVPQTVVYSQRKKGRQKTLAPKWK